MTFALPGLLHANECEAEYSEIKVHLFRKISLDREDSGLVVSNKTER